MERRAKRPLKRGVEPLKGGAERPLERPREMRRVATSYHIIRVKKKQNEARLIARPAMRVFWPVCWRWGSPFLFSRRIAPPICTRKDITSLKLVNERRNRP